jgi:alkylation response protein AidB-like acyl-CoA dehydrogenase
MIGALCGVFGGCLPEPAAREVYGADLQVITAGTFRPTGPAVAVDASYRVTGRWPLASGCQNATWLVGGARIVDGDQPRLTPTGAPVWRLFFFPARDCLVINTWHAAGLRGTGSHDFTVADLFVPAPRSLSFREPPAQTGPLYALPLIAFFATGLAAVPLGIARPAISLLEDLAGAKKPTWSANALREQPLAQSQVGQAEAMLRAGRAFLYETLQEAWETVRAGGRLTREQRALLWLAATQATSLATQAVDLMFSAGGATSVYASASLERCLRDIRTAAQHITVIPNNYGVVGQVLSGLDVSASQLSIDDRGDG